VYSTCLFCHASLGANQVIEHLPIGRRLAFDGAQGRLWVVCAKCRRWNLTPIEERWEAIEECERQYRTARVRASTDEIGLARLPEGLELVHIGKPPRAELVARQYVDTFRRRRQRAMIVAGVGAAALVGFGGWVAFAGAAAIIQFSVQMAVSLRPGARAIRFAGPDGKRIVLTAGELSSLEWIPPYAGTPSALRLTRESLFSGRVAKTSFHGEQATRALRPILAQMNRFAGRPAEVQQAADQLNREGDPMADRVERLGDQPRAITTLSVIDRLSFEMSLAERDEQKLLAGELAGLTAAWREAEEIGAIADNLFVPESVTAWLRRQKSNQDRSAS